MFNLDYIIDSLADGDMSAAQAKAAISSLLTEARRDELLSSDDAIRLHPDDYQRYFTNRLAKFEVGATHE